MTFVDVFVKVFDRGNRCGDLNIDVAIVFLGEDWVVRNDMAVVEQKSMSFDFHSIVRPAIDRISILSDGLGYLRSQVSPLDFFMQCAFRFNMPQGS